MFSPFLFGVFQGVISASAQSHPLKPRTFFECESKSTLVLACSRQYFCRKSFIFFTFPDNLFFRVPLTLLGLSIMLLGNSAITRGVTAIFKAA